jgi:phenylpyruvate tautomerase PptA (4-oxalocrotonate tautomerase family)
MRKEENKEEAEQKAQLVKDLTAWAKDQSYLDLYTLCENLGVI